jgi:ankyrin repeat protein
MYSFGSLTATATDSTNNIEYALFYISTNNLKKFKEIIKAGNVDSIIDKTNGFNSIHYAIKFGYTDFIKYLLSIGASPYIKTHNNKDAFDLSIEYNSRICIQHILDESKVKKSESDSEIKTLKRKLDSSEQNYEYLQKKSGDISGQNTILRDENKRLKVEVSSFTLRTKKLENSLKSALEDVDDLKYQKTTLTSQLSDSQKELKKIDSDYKKLRAEYNDLDSSYEGLLKSKRNTKS